MPNYATIPQAQVYFDGRLNTEGWDTSSSVDKLKALTMATRTIDSLNYIGIKHIDDETQENQFPRGDDTVVPQDIINACAEIALAYLNEFDIEEELSNLRVTSERYASIGVSYDPRIQSEYLLAGVPSKVAWDYLKPYLRDPRNIGLRKV
jgi:hypothetical protein